MLCACYLFYLWVCRCAGLCICALDPSFRLSDYFCSACCCCSCTYHVCHTVPQAQALYFVAATVQQQSHIKLSLSFVTATDGSSVVHACACYVHACVCVLRLLWQRTHNLIKRGARMLRRGQGDTNPRLLPRDFNSNCAAHGYNNSSGTTAVQQRQRFKLWP